MMNHKLVIRWTLGLVLHMITISPLLMQCAILGFLLYFNQSSNSYSICLWYTKWISPSSFTPLLFHSPSLSVFVSAWQAFAVSHSSNSVFTLSLQLKAFEFSRRSCSFLVPRKIILLRSLMGRFSLPFCICESPTSHTRARAANDKEDLNLPLLVCVRACSMGVFAY